jgi:hypothetical protein
LRQGTQISPLIFLPFIFLPFYLEIWKAIGKKMMGKKIKEQPATNDSKTERKKKFRRASKILCILFIHVQVVCESKCKFIAWRVVEAVGWSHPEQG